MSDVVIVEAVRSPVGRRGGGLSTIHSADLLGRRPEGDGRRAGRRPGRGRARSSAAASARSACRPSTSPAPPGWPPGLPHRPAGHDRRQPVRLVAAGHQHRHAASSAAGVVDVAVGVRRRGHEPGAHGVAASPTAVGNAVPKATSASYECTTQFEGAERIAEKWGITREELDAFGLESQRAGRARRGPRTASTPRSCRSTRPTSARTASPPARPHRVDPRRGPARDHPRGARRAQAGGREPTASTPPAPSSQISDGAGAVLLMTRREGRARSASAPRPGRRHLPGRLRPGADADRPDRRHPSAPRAHRARRWTTSTSSRSTRRSPRSCWRGQREMQPRHGQGQPQRRRHRPRPPARRHRRRPA